MAIRMVLLVAALAGGLAGAAQAAGRVQVQFVDPEHFADVGYGVVDRERNLEILTAHMKRWEARLPDGQELAIDVLDVDLAGEIRPWWFRWYDVRVLKGGVDGPRMKLRWSLKADGQTVKSGEDRLSDMGYLLSAPPLRREEALAYDKRMLDNWLRDRVIGEARAAR